jgi:hypothetical protein
MLRSSKISAVTVDAAPLQVIHEFLTISGALQRIAQVGFAQRLFGQQEIVVVILGD